MKCTEQQHLLPWRLRFQAKARHHDFNLTLKLSTTPYFSNLSPHRYSLLLKLRHWHFRADSELGSQSTTTRLGKWRNATGSKLWGFFKKLGIRRRKKSWWVFSDRSAKQFVNQGVSDNQGRLWGVVLFVVLGFLAIVIGGGGAFVLARNLCGELFRFVVERVGAEAAPPLSWVFLSR